MEKVTKGMAERESEERKKNFGESAKLNLARAMAATCAAAGLPLVSDENCCRLLAWVYVFGGECEAIALNPSVRNAVMYAQCRLNIDGGEIPNQELVPLLKRYIKEAEMWEASCVEQGYGTVYQNIQKAKKIEPPPLNMECPAWVKEIEARYGVYSYITRRA
jgi:hypothetical protein